MPKYIVNQSGIRVRTSPSLTKGSTPFYLDKGDIVEGDVRGEWIQYSVVAGKHASLGNAYSYSPFFTEITETPVPPPNTGVKHQFRVGFNCIAPNMRPAEHAAALGCRQFIILNSFLFATQLKEKYPDANVLVRQVEYQPTSNPVNDINRQLEGGNERKLIYTTLNEDDRVPGGPNELEKFKARLDYELKCAYEFKRRGIGYVLGNWAMGNWQIVDPAQRELFKSMIAPGFNAGDFDLGYHGYDDDERDENMQPWLPLRTGFWYANCGLSLNAKGKLYHTEWGFDKMGLGGYPARGLNPDQVCDHLYHLIAGHKKPFMGYDNVQIPFIPAHGGMVFQLGEKTRWAGYDVEYCIDRMAQRGLFNVHDIN